MRRACSKQLRFASKKNSFPKRGTRRNQLIRTNHSRRACLVSTPVGSSSQTLRTPCFCALCVKASFPASPFIATFAQERGLVAQVPAALFQARDLRLLSAKAHTSVRSQPSQNPHLHKNTGGWVHAKDFYVAPRTLARHSAFSMWGRQRKIAFGGRTS